MKHFSLLATIISTLYILPSLAIAQNDDIGALFSQKVAKSGCCKVRKSTKHPWAKTNTSFARCEASNDDDGDRIYKNSGLYWWDRSC